MAYQVGISSGWWNIGKDPNLMGLAQKAGSFGATTGVQFNQVDLDSIIEFVEPQLKKQMDEVIKTMGIKVGLHGEIGEVAALESAERRIYDQVHKRTVASFKFAKEFGFVYINVHGSQKAQLQQEESRLRPYGYTYPVVDYLGRPFGDLAEDGTKGGDAVREFIKTKIQRASIIQSIQGDDKWEKFEKEKEEEFEKQKQEEIKKYIEAIEKSEEFQKAPKELQEYRKNEIKQEAEQRKLARLRNLVNDIAFVYKVWKVSSFAKYLLDGGEVDAYLATAVYMYHNRDPIWMNIVGSHEPEFAYVNMEEQFNSAVAAKYHEGHLKKKNGYLDGMSIKEFCEKNAIFYLIETPHSQSGSEGLARFYRPIYLYQFVKAVNSPFVRVTIDFEQVMGQNINLDDPKEGVASWPSDIGKYIQLLHLGEPKPYWGTAHIPIALGSIGHEALYRWIYHLRKKGFKDGIIIFERGSGRSGGGKTMFEVFEYSVQAIRNIVKFLEQDMPPEKLPPEFYGISLHNPDFYALQEVQVRNHAWDPLEGTLSIAEEKHTFLSGVAVQRQKGQEYEKRKFR